MFPLVYFFLCTLVHWHALVLFFLCTERSFLCCGFFSQTGFNSSEYSQSQKCPTKKAKIQDAGWQSFHPNSICCTSDRMMALPVAENFAKWARLMRRYTELKSCVTTGSCNQFLVCLVLSSLLILESRNPYLFMCYPKYWTMIYEITTLRVIVANCYMSDVGLFSSLHIPHICC